MQLRSLTGLLLCLFLTGTALADDAPKGFTKIKTLGGIEEYQMDSNQLSVLLMEDHSAPVLTFMVTYRVGSRNEVTGTTGATHILEHLMFKGTPTFNKEKGTQIAATLQNIGALMNATTWLDRTNYYENIPNDHLELAVHLEADRMRNSLLREEDRQSEMTVVRNEFERGENSPFSALNKVIWGTAIQAHPYHHSTIGWRSDIENVPIEKLRDFYNTFYWPNNATISLIGDFKKKDALALIKKYFGEISASPHEIPALYTADPEQQGQRRVVVKRAGQLGVVGIAHKVPEGAHEDTYALSVLSTILDNGKTSRFYRALNDQSKAVNTFIFYFPFHDASLFVPYVFLAPGVTHEEVEKIVLDEYEKVKTEGVTQAEVDRAISQIAASTAFDRDGSFSIASQLNESIAMGDWTTYVTFLDNIRKVTPEAVQAVAQKYFNEDQSTVGYFVPEVPGGAAGGPTAESWQEAAQVDQPFFYRHPKLGENDPAAQPLDDALLDNYTYTPAEEIAPLANAKREKVNGIDLVTVPTGVQDVITFTGSFAAGDFMSGAGNSMIADMVGQMLDKGTTKNDKFALAEKLENLGAELSFSVDAHTLNFRGKCLKKDLDTVVGLLAEQLRYPAFDAAELDKVKKEREGGLKQLLENTNVRASYAMQRLIFPENHPNYQTPLDKMMEDVNKVSVEDLKAFHKKFYGPGSMVMVVVGDLEDKAVRQSVAKAFKGWSGGQGYSRVAKTGPVNGGKDNIVYMEEKTSATLMLAQATGLQRTDPDYLPLMVGNYILGGNFSARLMSTVRDEEGLTYGINSSLGGDIFSDGYWQIQGTFSPDLLAKGIASTRRELKKWVEDGVSAEELKNKKTTLIGLFKVSLATTGGLAGQLHSIIQRGYDVDYLEAYPKKIEALTLEEVNAAIRKYVDPDNVVTVIAGTVDQATLTGESE